MSKLIFEFLDVCDFKWHFLAKSFRTMCICTTNLHLQGSGEANNTELIWVTIKPSWKPADTLGLIKDPWVAPGEYEYSDSNNYLLGMVAELHTGKDLSVLYRERFLNPLDLSAALLPDEPVPEGTARPYTDLAYWGGSGFGDMIEWDAI